MTGFRHRAWPFVAAAVMAMGLHLAYSPYGYPVVDESMIHAMSRRLLAGEVPHRDFIFSRLAFTPLLMAPVVALESEHLMLLSRLWWWIEMTTVAFLWVTILERACSALSALSIRIPLSILVLMLSVHVHPPMTWYTTDGVFFATVGYWLLQHDSKRVAALGGLVLGLSVISKQNFGVIPLLALLAEGRWLALLAAIPVGAYFGAIALAGGMPDFLLQQFGHSDLFTPGIGQYLRWAGVANPFLFAWVLLTAAAAAQDRYLGLKAWAHRAARATLAASLAVWAALPSRHSDLSMTLFWEVAIYCVALRSTLPIGWRGAVVPIGLAWASSISNGWPTRALGSAPLGVLAGAIWLGTGDRTFASATERRGRSVVLWSLAAVAVVANHQARGLESYCDRPRKELIYDLGPVLPGWSGIYTSKRTFDYVSEAESLAQEFGGNGVAIIPDFPGHWVPAGRINPLPIDWVYGVDLPLPELVQRVTNAIDENRGRIAILVGKYDVMHFDLAVRVPYRTGKNPVVDRVTDQWTLVHRGEYFDVYR